MTDERLVLHQVVRRVEAMVRPGARVPRVGGEDHDVAVVATAILRRGFILAHAVHLLTETSTPEGAIPNLRSLFEAFGELNYLLSGSDSTQKAQTAFLFALQQMEDYQNRWRDSAGELAEIQTELAKHAASSPDAYKAASGRRNFWAPGSRADLIDAALKSLPRSANGAPPEELGRQLYKLLSWDDHHVMAVLLSVDLVPESATYGTIRGEHVMEDPAGFISLLAFMALEGMRRWYVARFPETETPVPGAT